MNAALLARNGRAALLAACLPCCAVSQAAEPPAGRYRCYEPPSYSVTAWFDLLPDGRYQFQGEPAQRFSYEPGTRHIAWLAGELASSHGGGEYQAPAPGAAAGQRHTIVLLPLSKSAAGPRTECYLTTH